MIPSSISQLSIFVQAVPWIPFPSGLAFRTQLPRSFLGTLIKMEFNFFSGIVCGCGLHHQLLFIEALGLFWSLSHAACLPRVCVVVLSPGCTLGSAGGVETKVSVIDKLTRGCKCTARGGRRGGGSLPAPHVVFLAVCSCNPQAPFTHNPKGEVSFH